MYWQWVWAIVFGRATIASRRYRLFRDNTLPHIDRSYLMCRRWRVFVMLGRRLGRIVMRGLIFLILLVLDNEHEVAIIGLVGGNTSDYAARADVARGLFWSQRWIDHSKGNKDWYKKLHSDVMDCCCNELWALVDINVNYVVSKWWKVKLVHLGNWRYFSDVIDIETCRYFHKFENPNLYTPYILEYVHKAWHAPQIRLKFPQRKSYRLLIVKSESRVYFAMYLQLIVEGF